MSSSNCAVVRVIVIKNDGKQHLEILRKIAQGIPSLLTTNHVAPLWREVHFDDIVFGVFPFIGASVQWCCEPWLMNSVGDIIDMILQCLEALAFIHSLGIAHRDADKSNFMLQWYPESLATMHVPLTRPRVYLHDFEFAVDFCNPDATTELGPMEGCIRNLAPEVYSGTLYDPFKADIWLFGDSFATFQSTIPLIDDILESLTSEDTTARLTAAEARDQLATVVHSMLPASLLICPVVFEKGNSNHTIPLFDTVEFADITFGVFPKVGFRVADAYGFWAQNSVGDVIDMLRQCLEGLAFLEAAGVAHRDAFKDNFLIQWHPESLHFEVAIKFPDEATYEECVASGIPTGGSFPDDTAGYKRPVPPEMGSGEPYNALKMDVWQLAKSFEDFKSTIPQIDELLKAMRDPESSRRPASSLALSYLAEVLSSIPPKALFIAPVFIQTNYGVVTPPPGA
ncbi:hypothetical protein ACG7TL_003254 [Trametes sanguinea]